MRNPFEFGRELTAGELVNRSSEVAAVMTAIRDHGRLFLIGPRRHGKTSVLHAATNRAEKLGSVVLRYDAEAFPTLEQLAARLAADAAARLTPTVERAGAAIRRFFSVLRPEARFDPADATWTVTLGGALGRESGVPLLADVLGGVERLAAQSKIPVAVIIDEFQRIVERDGVEAERQLRAAIQRQRHVAYVFAGSATRLLHDMTTDTARPFYKLGSVVPIGPLPRAEFLAFLERAFTSSHITVKPGATEAILAAAEEVPYNVQLLAHECWEFCRARIEGGKGQPTLVLTPALVLNVHEAVALRYDPLYTQIWTGLTSTQQRTLAALLRSDDAAAPVVTEIARRHDMPATTVQRALEGLEQKGILREELERGTRRRRLEDPLFGEWIRLTIAK